MRESSLQWSLRLGAIAAVLGCAAQVIGGRLVPTGQTGIDQVAVVLVIDGMLVLIALGVALGLAYFAGIRAERDRSADPGPRDVTLSWGGERRDSALAGGIVMLIYWALTTIAAFLFAPRLPGTAGISDFVTQHLIALILFVLFGLGMGALGGRAPAARNLLAEITRRPEAAEGLAEPVDASTPGAGIPAPSPDAP